MNALIRTFWTLVALAFMTGVNMQHADAKKENVKAKKESKQVGGHRLRPV